MGMVVVALFVVVVALVVMCLVRDVCGWSLGPACSLQSCADTVCELPNDPLLDGVLVI